MSMISFPRVDLGLATLGENGRASERWVKYWRTILGEHKLPPVLIEYFLKDATSLLIERCTYVRDNEVLEEMIKRVRAASVDLEKENIQLRARLAAAGCAG